MFDLPAILQTIGYAGIAAIVFAESGLFFGFFLPGDTLLFSAGFLAGQGVFNIWLLIPLIIIAAILGDTIGYWSGNKLGSLLFTREESFWLNKKRLEQARVFFERHGGKSVILARFIPFVRTFTPIVAGAVHMRYKTFVIYNVAGGILWGFSVTILGYILGETVPDIDRYLIPAVILAFVLFTGLVSLAPLVGRFFERHKP